jgi:hypothetical protein
MHSNEFDIYELSASHRLPSPLNPGLRYEAVDQDVKVGIPILLEFKNSNVRDGDTELALQIYSPFRECLIDVLHRICTADQLWIDGQCEKTP